MLSQVDDQLQFIRQIEPFRPDIVVFDSLASCFRFDTNKHPGLWDMVNAFLRDLRLVATASCSYTMPANWVPSAGARMEMTTSIFPSSCRLSRDGRQGNGNHFEWTYEKVRAGGRLQGFSARLDSMGNWVVDDEAEQRAIEMLKAGQSIRAVAKESGLTKGKVEGLKKKWLM